MRFMEDGYLIKKLQCGVAVGSAKYEADFFFNNEVGSAHSFNSGFEAYCISYVGTNSSFGSSMNCASTSIVLHVTQPQEQCLNLQGLQLIKWTKKWNSASNEYESNCSKCCKDVIEHFVKWLDLQLGIWLTLLFISNHLMNSLTYTNIYFHQKQKVMNIF